MRCNVNHNRNLCKIFVGLSLLRIQAYHKGLRPKQSLITLLHPICQLAQLRVDLTIVTCQESLYHLKTSEDCFNAKNSFVICCSILKYADLQEDLIEKMASFLLQFFFYVLYHNSRYIWREQNLANC